MYYEKTRDEDGLYFGYFKEKKDAEEFLEKQIRRYLFTPEPDKMSVRKICKEAQSRGIKLYQNTFSRELDRRGIEIRGGYSGREANKERKNFMISTYVLDELENFKDGPGMSYITNLALKIALGFPTEDVIIFLPQDEGEMPTNLIFRHTGGTIEAIVSGELDRKFEQQLRMVLQRARERGVEAVVEYAEMNNYTYLGGTTIYEVEEELD